MPFERAKKINLAVAVCIIASGVIVDQITKWMVSTYLHATGRYPVIPGLLDFELARNRGAAFGIGAGWDPFWQAFVFIGLRSLAVVAIFWWLYKSITEKKIIWIAISLILAGAIGNLYDSLFHRSVVDFILVHYKSFSWPNFNVADTLISIGVGLFVINTFLMKKPKSEESPSA